jgi:predicted XRE-type DNA-binding protein
LANGFTPQERFENMHFEIADFHSEMKFMQVRVYMRVYIKSWGKQNWNGHIPPC